MNLLTKTLVIGLASISISTAASADVWAERQALAQVTKEMQALERLVNETSKLSKDDSRVRFSYDSLMYDLKKIREGVERHLAQPINPVLPSEIKNLRGNYTGTNH